jgi:hypothetical protein
LLSDPFDLLPRRGALLLVQFHCLCAGKPPLGAVHNRGHHLQIADQFRAGSRRGFLLLLRFEKQRGIIQNTLANHSRSPAPSCIQLAGFARIAVMRGEDGGHPLAILQALPRHRHQKLHRHLRCDLAFAHLVLDGPRQKLH